MSLLIDALKKQRLTPTSSVAQVGGDVFKSVPVSKAKKIILISLSTVIVVSLTATGSFLIFKYVEKKRMSEMLRDKMAQVEKTSGKNIQSILEEKSGEGKESLSEIEGQGELREKLLEKIQERKKAQAPTPVVENNAATTPTSSIDSLAQAQQPEAASTSDAPAASADTTSSASPAATNESLRARLNARRAGGAAASLTNNNNAQTNNSASADALTTAPSSNTDSQDNVSSDTTDSSSQSNNRNDSSSEEVKVDIQTVPDDLGANNPVYLKALEFMQANQYDKALSLLENNEGLLLKTQGLSALLLARIYLATGEYELADKTLDRAMMLHAGSEMDLLALRAQALFMQRKYQETIDLLSSQSPDLTSSPSYYALLADAYMHLDQASNAVSVFQQIVARFPNSPEYWLGLAVAYQKTGDASSAMVAYRRAAQLSPDDPQVTLFINQQLQSLETT